MERTLSPEERIKRAEEIYYRRRVNNRGIRVPTSTVNVGNNKPEYNLFKKMVLQILICFVIYAIFYLIQNTNYFFSDNVLKKTKEFLTTDINFNNIYNSVVNYINNNKDYWSGLWNKNQIQENTVNSENVANTENSSNTNIETNSVENGETTNNEQTSSNNEVINNENNVGMGGEKDNSNSKDIEKSQMEIDGEYIKSKYEPIIPVSGTVTSRYGTREPTEIISANHKGIDIGANTGTPIYASIEGTVTLVSDEGDYGTHVKIENEDILTIYAHCSEILVKEGDKIKKGDKIALVGSTGNSTGPHLHFEVRRDNRTVNPEYIVDFG